MKLMFVDDLLIFTKPNPHSLGSLKVLIDTFAKVSKLYINNTKSVIYLAGVQKDDKDIILDAIGVPKEISLFVFWVSLCLLKGLPSLTIRVS